MGKIDKHKTTNYGEKKNKVSKYRYLITFKKSCQCYNISN